MSTGAGPRLRSRRFIWETPDVDEILGLAEIIERTASHMGKCRSLYAALVEGCREYRGYMKELVQEAARRASSGEYTVEELAAKLEETFPTRGKILRLLLLSRVDLEELSRNIRELHMMLLSEAVIARKLASSLREMHRRALLLLSLLTASSIGLLRVRDVLAGASVLRAAQSTPWYALAAVMGVNIVVLSRLCQLSIVRSLLATVLGALLGYLLFWVVF